MSAERETPHRTILAHLAGALVPPLLVRLATATAERRKTCPTFAEARRRSAGTYASDALSRFRVERARLNVADLTSAAMPPAYGFALLAVQLARAAEPRIVDLGGACGEWAYLMRAASPRPFSWIVVENPELVRRCAGDPFFSWARWETQPPADLDVFVTSGTLQYLDDPYGALAFAFAHARDFVVMGRNCFAEREIFRVARSRLSWNGAGERLPPGFEADALVEVPHRTVAWPRVLDQARAAGWRLVLQATCDSAVLPYGNECFGRDLLFART